MSNIVKIVLLLCQLVSVTIGQDVLNGDCLDFQAFEYFRYSPGQWYDPMKGIDGIRCAQLCSDSLMPHAGVVARKYCLCSRESEFDAIKTIPKVTGELCQRSDDYVAYYRGKAQNKVKKLKVKADKEIAVIDEEVFFELSSGNPDIEYSLDFGDGSDHSEWSAANELRHRYYMSGTFVVTVYARIADKPKTLVTEMTTITIEGEVKNDNVLMACPTVVEPGDMVDCNLTLAMGTKMQMTMDYGDGVYTPMINLPGMF